MFDTCPRCGYPGKDLRSQAAGRRKNPKKGFGTASVRAKALATRRKNAAAREVVK
jgi:hypothetical protein